jgi:ubiquinone biosynthesis monooxygenase Coq7
MYKTIDKVITEFDKALRTCAVTPISARPVPGAGLDDVVLSDSDKHRTASLMRVNHCGEVCAQALYQGQALTCNDPALRDQLAQAAQEENDHLAWSAQRIDELGGRVSLLNPLWYAGSLGIGMLAGRWGDAWNLGFLAETERQVEQHLARHIERLPAEDGKTKAVLEQMQRDEAQHARLALELGARELPVPAKLLMKAASRAMTTIAYWI